MGKRLCGYDRRNRRKTKLVTALVVLIATALAGPWAGEAFAQAGDLVSQVPGSPFADGTPLPSTAGDLPLGVAFSPSGTLLATVSPGQPGFFAVPTEGHVSVFNVAADGSLTPVSGSPFTVPGAGAEPDALAFSPSGALLAIADREGSDITVFAVGAGGALTPVSGSPFKASEAPASIAFNPSGTLLATANADSTVSLFTVGSGGALTQVPSSPFNVGSGTAPISVAFNHQGTLLATADQGSGQYSVFGVSGDTLIPVTGSPFSVDATISPVPVKGVPTCPVAQIANCLTLPSAVTFNPSGTLLAGTDDGVTTQQYGNYVSVYKINGGEGSLTPAQASPFDVGQWTVPDALEFSPAGNLLATADQVGGLSILTVSPAGVLKDVAGSPYSVGSNTAPTSVAFSPSGHFVATANTDTATVSVFAMMTPSLTVTGGGRTGPGRITMTGTAPSGAPVQLYVEPYRASKYHKLGPPVTAGSNGTFTFSKVHLSRSTSYYVEADGLDSLGVQVAMHDQVTLHLTPGRRKVFAMVKTLPAVDAVSVTFYRIGKHGKQIKLKTVGIAKSSGVVSSKLALKGSKKVTIEAVVSSGDGTVGGTSKKETVALKA